MYLLKIGFSRITPQTLTDPDKILQEYRPNSNLTC